MREVSVKKLLLGLITFASGALLRAGFTCEETAQMTGGSPSLLLGARRPGSLINDPRESCPDGIDRTGRARRLLPLFDCHAWKFEYP
jgi:hypothetical protein